MRGARAPVLLSALCVAGCASQMVQQQVKDTCEKQGKRALVIGSEHSGIPLLIESANATYYCVRPADVVHTGDSFGVDAVSLGDPPGAAVLSAAPGSPSARAGLVNGDLIYEFAGHPVANAAELRQMVADTAAGSQVEIRLRRNGKEVLARVTF